MKLSTKKKLINSLVAHSLFVPGGTLHPSTLFGMAVEKYDVGKYSPEVIGWEVPSQCTRPVWYSKRGDYVQIMTFADCPAQILRVWKALRKSGKPSLSPLSCVAKR